MEPLAYKLDCFVLRPRTLIGNDIMVLVRFVIILIA